MKRHAILLLPSILPALLACSSRSLPSSLVDGGEPSSDGGNDGAQSLSDSGPGGEEPPFDGGVDGGQLLLDGGGDGGETSTEVAQCGSAHRQANLPSAPSSVPALCATGTPSTVRGNGPWTWTCTTEPGNDAACVAAPAAIHWVDMTGATLLQVMQQITAAQTAYFGAADSAAHNTTVVLSFPAGTYDFYDDTSVSGSGVYCSSAGQTCTGTNSIEVSKMTPGPEGRLVLLGAGSSGTTFLFNPDQTQLRGVSASRVTFAGLRLELVTPQTSQGTVVDPSKYAANEVVLDIPPAFPSLAAYPVGLFSSDPGVGHYLRRYHSDGLTYCHIDTTVGQQHYTNVVPDPIVAGRWQFQLSEAANPFSAGDLVGVKSEHGGGQAYFFENSTDIIFDDIVWYRGARGVARVSSTQVQVYDSEATGDAVIGGQPVCMTSAAGGPQIGQPMDPSTSGNVVDGFRANNTGDDSLAVFNNYGATTSSPGVTILNTSITDSFARSINFYQSADPTTQIDAYTFAHLTNCNRGTDGNIISSGATNPKVGTECVLYTPPP